MRSGRWVLCHLALAVAATLAFYDQYRAQGFRFTWDPPDPAGKILAPLILGWCAILINAYVWLLGSRRRSGGGRSPIRPGCKQRPRRTGRLRRNRGRTR